MLGRLGRWGLRFLRLRLLCRLVGGRGWLLCWNCCAACGWCFLSSAVGWGGLVCYCDRCRGWPCVALVVCRLAGATQIVSQNQKRRGDRLTSRLGREGGLVASAARRPSVASVKSFVGFLFLVSTTSDGYCMSCIGGWVLKA